MSSYRSYKDGCNRDFRYESDYKPTINVPSYYNPGQKRQYQRVHHDSSTNRPEGRWPRRGSVRSQSENRPFSRK